MEHLRILTIFAMGFMIMSPIMVMLILVYGLKLPQELTENNRGDVILWRKK